MLKMEGAGHLRRHRAPDQEKLAQYAALGLPAERLAMAAGEYCAVGGSDTTHWGLGVGAYCHATSPIRRFADCVNQLVLARRAQENLKDTVITATGLNALAKRAKAFERDLAFARALIGPDAAREVGAFVVEAGQLWVPAWGRIVRAETEEGVEAGTPVRMKVYCDASQRNWKRRLVLRAHCEN